ncbi:MAG TPA: low molecular weight protein arginine phosphatase [Bacillus sp. (in: firmicutes)]|nr:low molecular weight protein arginine phosphatase [Bacillus sp. (in: firmicutes)]
MERILFVCTGNTCRSPMAEALLKAKKLNGIEVKSAGVHAFPGSDASEYAKEALKEIGIEHSHAASLLDQELVDWATRILTMTSGHKQLIIRNIPNAAHKTSTLKEFVAESNSDVSDPFGSSLDVYRKTLNELKELVDKLVERLT